MTAVPQTNCPLPHFRERKTEAQRRAQSLVTSKLCSQPRNRPTACPCTGAAGGTPDFIKKFKVAQIRSKQALLPLAAARSRKISGAMKGSNRLCCFTAVDFWDSVVLSLLPQTCAVGVPLPRQPLGPAECGNTFPRCPRPSAGLRPRGKQGDHIALCPAPSRVGQRVTCASPSEAISCATTHGGTAESLHSAPSVSSPRGFTSTDSHRRQSAQQLTPRHLGPSSLGSWPGTGSDITRPWSYSHDCQVGKRTGGQHIALQLWGSNHFTEGALYL